MVIPRKCMLRQAAVWVGISDSGGPATLGAGPLGRGRGGVLYVYIIYRELKNGLRKALPERWSCVRGRIGHSKFTKSLGYS